MGTPVPPTARTATEETLEDKSWLPRRGDKGCQLWASLLYTGWRGYEGMNIFVHIELVALLTRDCQVEWWRARCACAPGVHL